MTHDRDRASAISAGRQPDRLRPHAAQGGRALPARQGQLRRRRQPARHAARRHPAQPVRPRPHRLDRHLGGRGPPQGARPSSPAPTLETLGLAWMPTLSYDMQAVLATDKVRFQGQEVAFVVAEDRYSARDALELIDVEYEPLPGDRRQAGARRRRPGHPRRHRGQDRQPHLRLGGGRQGATDAVFAERRRRRRRRTCSTRASHPAPMETCGIGRRHGPGHRQAHDLVHHPGAARPPHASTRWWPACPSTRSRSSRPTSAAASATRCRIYPGYVLLGRRLDRHRQAGEVDGGPLREPDVHRRSPATTTCTARSPPPRDGKILGAAGRRARRPRRVQRHRPADEVPGRLLPHLHRLLRPRGGALQGDGRLHQQGAGRRGLRLLVPHHRGGVPRRAHGRLPGRRAGHGPGRAADEEPAAARAVPVHHPDRAGSTTRATTRGRCSWRCDMAGYDELRAEQAEKRANGRADGHRHQLLHRGRRRRAAQAHGHPRPRHGRRLRAAGAPDRQGAAAPVGADPGPGPRDDVRPDRGRTSSGIPPEDIEVDPRRHRQHAVRPRHLRLAVDAGVGRGGGGRRPAGPGQGPRSSPRPRSSARRTTSSGSWAAGSSRATPSRARRSRRSPCSPTRSLELPEGVEGHLDASAVYNPPNLTYPFGAYICVVDVDPGTGAGQGAAVHRRRRLRPADQPDDRRGPGARRPGRRHRHGADAGDRLRRGRQLPRRVVHGLPAADVDGVPDVGSWARRSRRRRTTRSAARASASRPPSARRRRWSTR